MGNTPHSCLCVMTSYLSRGINVRQVKVELPVCMRIKLCITLNMYDYEYVLCDYTTVEANEQLKWNKSSMETIRIVDETL